MIHIFLAENLHSIFCAGIYFDVPEITPSAVGVFRFDSNNDVVSIQCYSAFSMMCSMLSYMLCYHATG